MRKKHIEVLKDRISHADVGWLARQGWNLLSVHASFKRKKVMNSPIFGGLVITYRCNETCPMCNVYKLGDKVREMKTDEWLDIVDQFAELKVTGISITGGEPLVYEGILDIIRHIKSHKIPVSMSTNGLLLRRKGLADKLLDTGIDSIAISIDGASPAEHDESRGIKGAFERTIDAIKILVEARNNRRDLKKKIFITIASVINAHNYKNFEGILKLAEELGVDNVSLNPVQDTYVNNAAGHISDNAPSDLLFDKADNEITDIPKLLRKLKKRYKIMDSSNNYLDVLEDFFQKKEYPVQCYAPYFAFYVDCFQNILPCGGYYYDCRSVDQLEKGQSLKDIWYSKDYQNERDKLRDCRNCYYSCMAELNMNYVKK